MDRKTEVAILEAGEIVEFNESCIDVDEKLIFMTWTPDPKDLPKCNFILQHQFCSPYIRDFLQTVECGLFCVESTEMGNPHYHGWYQHSEDFHKEQARIAWMKVLDNHGNTKVTTNLHKSAIRTHCFTEHGNSLYYYKKELFTVGLFIPSNPISKSSVIPEIDIPSYWFDVKGRATASKIIEKRSTIQHMFDFYSHTKI